METKIVDKIVALILARLNGTITFNENTELEEWLAASEKNRALFDRIITGSNFDRYLKQSQEHDIRPYFQHFQKRVERQRRDIRVKHWAYVAAIVLPLLCTTWFFLGENLHSPQLAQESQVMPGSTKAMLVLPDGRVINLAGTKVIHTIHINNALLGRDSLVYARGKTEGIPEMHTLSIPRGGEFSVILSDGTKVWLNSETELRYPSCFIGRERRVFLKGEAYFEVAHDSLCPFFVESEKQELRVLGTSFSVRAYADEELVLTTLESGKVRVNASGKGMILQPGQQTRLGHGIIERKEVNTLLYTAWRTGKFVFIDQPLEEILTTLERWYDIQVFYTSPELAHIQFTGELPRYNNIEELLGKLEQLEKVRFSIRQSTVTVCPY